MKHFSKILILSSLAAPLVAFAPSLVMADHTPVEPRQLYRDGLLPDELPSEENVIPREAEGQDKPLSHLERALRKQEQELQQNKRVERERAKQRAAIEKHIADTQLPKLNGTRDENLATLFGVLKENRTQAQAKRAAAEIQRIWMQSGSDTIDLMMEWTRQAMQNRKFGEALDYLDNIVRLEPDFVEGWNKRATVHFMRRDFGRSIADVEQTLSLEPRHFGALSGLGYMLRELGRETEALEMLQRAYDINPTSKDVKTAIDSLKLKVGARDT